MLETFFTTEDIKEIYDELVIYSIKKYEMKKETLNTFEFELKNKIRRQYKRALLELKKRKINPEILNNKTIKQLEESLNNYKQNYYALLSLNKSTIDEVAFQMQEILLDTLLNIENELGEVAIFPGRKGLNK